MHVNVGIQQPHITLKSHMTHPIGADVKHIGPDIGHRSPSGARGLSGHGPSGGVPASHAASVT